MFEGLREQWEKLPKFSKLLLPCIGVVACVGFLFWMSTIPADQIPVSVYIPSTTCTKTTIQFFYSNTCPHCHNVMPFMKGIQENYTNVDVRYYEISNPTNNAMFVSINQARGLKQYGVPEVVVGNTVLIGDIEIPQKLEPLVPKC